MNRNRSFDSIRMGGGRGDCAAADIENRDRVPGVGLHCGQVVAITLRPAAPDIGIVFRRLDTGREIQARWYTAVESALSSVLWDGESVRVDTIEHLMAAFAGMAVDNAV